MNTLILIRDTEGKAHLVNPRHVVRVECRATETEFSTVIIMSRGDAIHTAYTMPELARVLAGMEGGY